MILRAVMFQAGWSTTGSATNNIEAERRFGDDWFAELRVRAFSGAEQGNTTYWLQKDDFVLRT
jgi:hypothetical protein